MTTIQKLEHMNGVLGGCLSIDHYHNWTISTYKHFLFSGRDGRWIVGETIEEATEKAWKVFEEWKIQVGI